MFFFFFSFDLSSLINEGKKAKTDTEEEPQTKEEEEEEEENKKDGGPRATGAVRDADETRRERFVRQKHVAIAAFSIAPGEREDVVARVSSPRGEQPRGGARRRGGERGEESQPDEERQIGSRILRVGTDAREATTKRPVRSDQQKHRYNFGRREDSRGTRVGE